MKQRSRSIRIGVLVLAFAATTATAQTWNYELVHAFGVNAAEGANPYAGLLQAADGRFYGTTTTSGGPPAAGAIFRMDAAWDVVPLHQFDAAFDCISNYEGKAHSALIQGNDGKLYGTNCKQPAPHLGTAFRIDSSGVFELLHEFSAVPEGASPAAALLLASNGLFYGTTSGGAANPDVCPVGACGAVFKMDASGNVTTLHNFSDSGDGAYPQAALIQATDGLFYGTTAGGRGSPGCPQTVGGCATAFKMDSSGSVTTIHGFGADYPDAPLLQALDGDFYSTTRFGGAFGFGNVFRMNSGGSVTTLHSFDVGYAYPSGSLLQVSNGTLYGMAGGCCGFSDGSLFTIDSLGAFATLHAFDGLDGAHPSGGLILATDGNLYGVCANGGPAGGGVIFRLTHASFAVNAIQPSSGHVAGGTAAHVLGGGFAAGASLTIGGTAAIDTIVPDQSFVNGTVPALTPGTLNDVTVTNPGNAQNSSGTIPNGFFADFLDVPQSDIFHDFVETIFRAAITAGYGDGNYGRNDSVTRAQMAVFLLKSEHGLPYSPPPCGGAFADVPCPASPQFPYSDWIEQLATEGITGGCLIDPLRYCPDRAVTRAEMAVLLLRTEHGLGYQPPACAGVFADVPCPSSPQFPYSDWIEQLALEGVTAGCGNGNYCPDSPNTRGEMAVFLVKTFGLQ